MDISSKTFFSRSESNLTFDHFWTSDYRSMCVDGWPLIYWDMMVYVTDSPNLTPGSVLINSKKWLDPYHWSVLPIPSSKSFSFNRNSKDLIRTRWYTSQSKTSSLTVQAVKSLVVSSPFILKSRLPLPISHSSNKPLLVPSVIIPLSYPSSSTPSAEAFLLFTLKETFILCHRSRRRWISRCPRCPWPRRTWIHVRPHLHTLTQASYTWLTHSHIYIYT